MGPKSAPEQQGFSFSSFLKARLTSRKVFTVLPKASFGF
jgi:hypothetical protein